MKNESEHFSICLLTLRDTFVTLDTCFFSSNKSLQKLQWKRLQWSDQIKRVEIFPKFVDIFIRIDEHFQRQIFIRQELFVGSSSSRFCTSWRIQIKRVQNDYRSGFNLKKKNYPGSCFSNNGKQRPHLTMFGPIFFHLFTTF